MSTPASPYDNPLIPQSLQRASGSVFHYTTSAGLLGILTNRCLWASEASSLNDLAEVRRGWELIRRWAERRRETSTTADRLAYLAQTPLQQSHEVFIVSATSAPDDANQWRLYAQQGHGYAIELDSTINLVAVSSAPPPATRPRSGIWATLDLQSVVMVTPWLHVLYDTAQVDEALDELDKQFTTELEAAAQAAGDEGEYDAQLRILEGHAYEALATIAHLVKAEGFSGEREIRIVATYFTADEHIAHRPGDNGVIGYTRLAPAPSANVSARTVLYDRDHTPGRRATAALPVKSVRLGPLLRSEHVSTVTRLLKVNDLPAASVSTSQVSLR